VTLCHATHYYAKCFLNIFITKNTKSLKITKMREIDFALASQERGNKEVFWRRERESNPRYTFVGIHTISSRAPSAARTSLPEKTIFFYHTDVNYHVFASTNYGGERGIRTPVGACDPQIDFESIPLRPLRYLSDYQIIFIDNKFTLKLIITFIYKNIMYY
jgi:hypothetical protein